MSLEIVETTGQVKRWLGWILDSRLVVGRRLSWPTITLLMFFVAGVWQATARSDDAKKIEPTEDASTIRGTVVDEMGAAAEGIRVFVDWAYKGGGHAETRSDRKGQFGLAVPGEVLPGVLVRAANDSGQLQAHYQNPWEPRLDRIDGVRLKLAPARHVELRVVDGAQQPIAEAKAGILSDNHHLASGPTDADGKAAFLVPHDLHVAFVYAFADGQGLDYRAYVLRRGQSGDKKAVAPKLPDEPVELTLDGTKPLRVRTVAADDAPIAGVKVYPWLLNKPDQPMELNLSYFVGIVHATTGADGYARFDWIPQWHHGPVTFWISSDDYVWRRGTYDPKTGDGTLTIQLQRPVPIRGRVTLPNGSPAAGIKVVACGAGYQDLDGFRGTAVTDALGRYEIKAAPDKIYLVIVEDKKWASQPRTGFAVWPDTPVDGLDFKLRLVSKVFGRVTQAADQHPVKGERIVIYQYGLGAHELKNVNLPNPEKSHRAIQTLIVKSTATDRDGNFELLVGPGKFDIRGPQNQSTVKQFEITTESQMEFNFHTALPAKGILTGRIVTGDPPRGVAEAQIVGIYRQWGAGLDMDATADAEGNFEVERELRRTVVHARSKDGALAGVVEIEAGDPTVTLVVRPLATASGRLIDAASGQPLAGREIEYGVKVHQGDDNSPWRTSFGGKAVTDEKGHFELKQLVLDQPYDVNVIIPGADNPANVTYHPVGAVRPQEAKDIPLGDLKLETKAGNP
ncbi:MAG TPA: carboxypeptidase-like regulatory domain-containing protein [Pirellulales bacterium]|nr:carboxypeptidase-like regulatory domain-containing protein [Pirellulales bacterium]